MERTPEESLIRSFLFATHTTVCFLELPGLKKPKAKLFPLETKDWSSLMNWSGVKEWCGSKVVNKKTKMFCLVSQKKEKKEKNKKTKTTSFKAQQKQHNKCT
ncbi:hypothetical protein RGQ29_019304 [Quercus rubra]|uniref:Uncharacterized protein n=1 Tax=Quercus rubra TaxID=3512 RepID=A0AAN7F8R6_QUERU|nr:hypothetical protein RGQ29_019304 [Quercus rubra]